MIRMLNTYVALILVNLFYAFVSICTKYASQQEVISIRYLIGLGGAICVLAVYAILWQQVLKHIDLSTAYMFKGTSLVFVMILAALLFGETITWMNVVGAVIIITGITLFAKA